MKFKRLFTTDNQEPYATRKVDVKIIKPDGEVVFQQNDVEAPVLWSDQAVSIVASKYFYGKQGTAERETSVFQTINRIVNTIAAWGYDDDYFDADNAKIFRDELYDILVMQRASFNSPVWFNVGVHENPQTSACFITSVEDSIDSIYDWYKVEGRIFKQGSGSGINISTLRSKNEFLSGGGHPSGPLSFMRAADAAAGEIRSGGTLRRAAKMVVMDDTHPDLLDFIDCKVKSEQLAQKLKAAGVAWEIGTDSKVGIPYQNSNHAVRLTDAFIRACRDDRLWSFEEVLTGKTAKRIPAREILAAIAKAVHFCGDPGIQFHDIVNQWNTCAVDGYIRASNPCAEFNWFDNSACNLASLKLTAFLRADGDFDQEAFKHAVRIMITAQDILIDRSAYPTDKIRENSINYRPLGLGYTDLGAFLMRKGIPYDSDEGRNLAAQIASMMTAFAYSQSAAMAAKKGPCDAYERNQETFWKVIEQHAEHSADCAGEKHWQELLQAKSPIRNMQTTLMAPTGTISFGMDCDTTGIEPELALVKYKNLVGGSVMRIINRSVEPALSFLGYSGFEIVDILKHISKTGHVEGVIKDEHLPIFDCAFKTEGSSRCLLPSAHLQMMAAVQPAISGAISKTVNLPEYTTSEDIENLILYAYDCGLKAVTFYRDGCKQNQPLTTTLKSQDKHSCKPTRKKLPTEALGKRHKFTVGGVEGYLNMGLYDDGSLGEIFVKVSKEGSTLAGLIDAIAILTSIALQFGIPLEMLVEKFSHCKFEPAGFTRHPEIKTASSLVDYIFRYLALNFLNKAPVIDDYENLEPVEEKNANGELCLNCGHRMYKLGTCFYCSNCGTTSGCS